MSYKAEFFSLRLAIVALFILFPLLTQAQSTTPKIEVLQNKIEYLSKVIVQLKSDQNESETSQVGLLVKENNFTQKDSLRVNSLLQKQKLLRVRVDALTLDLINISKQIKDPGTRHALAKKMRQSQSDNLVKSPDTPLDNPQISARSIDLEAVKLIREGKTLDQARLLTIDQFSIEQINEFYRALSKPDRHDLYDIADDIVNTDSVNLTSARRSAIYIFFFTR